MHNTDSGIPGNTMKDLRKLLQIKGIRLKVGFTTKAKTHWEIYLSDARKVSPDKRV
jgi:hypothetical protein